MQAHDSSQSAEYAQSGVRTNVVPKAGGNEFSYNFFMSGTSGACSRTTSARS